MQGEYKEVYFGRYCNTCKYKKLDESEHPCDECMSEPIKIDSHKPVKWEEKKSRL